MRKLAIVVALSSTAIASPALARDGAWYIGGDFGAMIVEDIGFDFGLTPTVPSQPSAQVVVNHDYGFDGALFAGYDFGGFRLEAEVAYKRARVDDIETVIRLPGQNTPGLAIQPDIFPAGGGHTSALSFMINGMLDFGDDDGISGFVGGGVGIARVDYNNIRAFENQGAFVDDSDSGFAWQVIAGVRQAITDNIDVTLRYRFFNVPPEVYAAFISSPSKGSFFQDCIRGRFRHSRGQRHRRGDGDARLRLESWFVLRVADASRKRHRARPAINNSCSTHFRM